MQVRKQLIHLLKLTSFIMALILKHLFNCENKLSLFCGITKVILLYHRRINMSKMDAYGKSNHELLGSIALDEMDENNKNGELKEIPEGLDDDLKNLINEDALIRSIVLVYVERVSGIIHGINVLKNDGIVYSLFDETGNLDPFNENYITDSIKKCLHIKVNKWINRWYDFLIDHLSKIYEKSGYVTTSYQGMVGEKHTTLYFVKDAKLIKLGSYAKDHLINYLNDVNAQGIIKGLMKNEALFWHKSSIEDNMEYHGKEKCNFLRSIRKKIAETNNIEYEPRECHYDGPCSGTCPACDSEIKYIDEALQRKRSNGEEINLYGISEEELSKLISSNKRSLMEEC